MRHLLFILPPLLALAAAAPAPVEAPTAPQPNKPPIPVVVYPSGDAWEGRIQSGTVVLTLPAVIHPADPAQQTGSGGSGFFIGHDGSIVTVGHVIQNCKRILVMSKYVKQTTATLLAVDARTDIAVIRADNLQPPAVLTLADPPNGPESLEIFGYPADGDALFPTQTHGQLQTERPTFEGVEKLDRTDMLWMDANAVRPGFSGGPILNPHGDVVGLINGQVVRRIALHGVVVRDTKYVFGGSTRTIKRFLSQEVPLLAADASRSPPPGETAKAIVRVLCMR